MVKGFSEGFDIGYAGVVDRQDYSQNIPLKVGTKEDLWGKIMKEVKLKRVAGPFSEIQFKTFIQTSIGLVPKAGNQTRLIFHLSYDFPHSGNKSLNASTPKELCRVKYKDLDHAISCCFQWAEEINGIKKIFYSKSDVQSAFRLVPLKRKCWKWLIFKAINPSTGKICYFTDKCLPFGRSISCSHFQKFSNAIRHILEVKIRRPLSITNYLDDFLFVGKTVRICNQMMSYFLTICNRLGVPISRKKLNGLLQLSLSLGSCWIVADLCFPFQRKK